MIVAILTDGLFAAVAGIGFGAISYPPRRAFPYIAVLAAIGHALRFYLMTAWHVDIAIASFCASLTIGIFALLFGRRIYCPMTVLYIPALLPMIPGMYAYKSVYGLLMFMQNLDAAVMSNLYLQTFLTNTLITVSTLFMLAIGATLPIFIIPKTTYSLTRKHKDKSNS
ncbi:MAG: threonine/serine exporter family protein [Prevotellaceae bacterium]|jgi:uncharacterized membrane protein YjjB (DUF3815 family)|nr:threonine/serine exporter family protein [Prevotellaceae bacterium]